MKNHLLLFSLLLFSFPCISQVTVTKEDVLEIGTTVVYQYLDSTYLESLVFEQEGGPRESAQDGCE